MSTLDKANWLYTNGYFSTLIFTLSENEINTIYARIRVNGGWECAGCGGEG